MQQEEELSPDELTALLSSYMPEIPGYRVLRRIGKGGMSQVYLSVQESLDRQVAIKVMSPAALTDEISKQRFEHEARTIAKLEHPCIVGIHEVGRTRQGLLYYVLPYLAKGHLGQRDFTQDEARAIEVLRALLSALEYAHARGIVHRDVKAENVLFDNADRPLLTDFGIALSKRDQTRITTAGLAVGSGGYMAPEQARGEVVDGRADLYSVGVLAYELLMGRLPYQAADPLALALMHAQDPVPRLPAEKKHWQSFLDRAMAKSPDNRYRNAQQMLSALNQIANGKPPEPAVDLARLKGKLAPHWKPAVAAVAGVALVAVLFAWFSRDRPEPPSGVDFFTVEDSPAPAPAVTAPAVPAGPEPAAEPAAAPADAPAPAPAFAGVSAEVTVTALDYDPTLPGARELAAARR
ncbi:serine/threonine-protein kinase, partial [Arenimonas sp.]|uniref:serine/threonine-protein kinase n=1 Tax=Arenimonas sp. TaxID=1872635 RepID=UPI0025BEE5CA